MRSDIDPTLISELEEALILIASNVPVEHIETSEGTAEILRGLRKVAWAVASMRFQAGTLEVGG